MALACTGKVTVNINLVQTNALDLSTPQDSVTLSNSRTLASGTGNDQCDLIWHDSRTLTNGATESIDLNGGTFNGAFGAVTFDKIKGIYIQNFNTENTIKIGGAAANALGLFDNTTDILVLPPAAATNSPSDFLLTAPAAGGVSATANDELKIAHGGTTTNTITYKILIWGED